MRGGTTRKELLAAVRAIPDPIEQGWFIIPAAEEDWDLDLYEGAKPHPLCHTHALNALRFVDVPAQLTDTWGEMGADDPERCSWCDVALDVGGLSRHGIDSALGLTETDPLKAYVTAAGLVQVAEALMPDDPRMSNWEMQADRVLRRERRRQNGRAGAAVRAATSRSW